MEVLYNRKITELSMIHGFQHAMFDYTGGFLGSSKGAKKRGEGCPEKEGIQWQSPKGRDSGKDSMTRKIDVRIKLGLLSVDRRIKHELNIEDLGRFENGG